MKESRLLTLRAKGTLISEPRFSTPCEMRFSPCEKGKMPFVEDFSLKRPFSLSRVGKIASRRGWKIGALALRAFKEITVFKVFFFRATRATVLRQSCAVSYAAVFEVPQHYAKA